MRFARLLAIASVASGLGLAAPSVGATTITFDFAQWAAVNGEHSFSNGTPFSLTVGGVNVTATATYNGSAAFVYLDAPDHNGPAGMGVCHETHGDCAGSDDDNITSDEIAKLVFGPGITLTSVVFRNQDHKTDEFDAGDQFRLRVGGTGSYTTYDLPLGNDGLWTTSTPGSIFEFKYKNEDFYISSVTVDVPGTVPEPGSLLLLGSGLLGLAGRARRRTRG